MNDQNTITQKDHWLVLGSTKEEQDDLTIKRFWLMGIETNKDALIIQFVSKYGSPNEDKPIVKGSVIEAELAFYPSTSPQRAFIKKQKAIHHTLEKKPSLIATWQEFDDHKIEETKLNPWISNRSNLIGNIRIINNENQLIAVDRDKTYKVISHNLQE